MERLTRMPAAVFAYFVAALYLTGLGYVQHARGENISALVVTLLGYAAALLVLRAAEKPAQ